MGKPKDWNDEINAELEKFEAQQRREMGIADAKKEHWVDEMTTPLFTASQRSKTTLLVGGLTMAADYFVEGALKGIGYNVRALDVADNTSLRFGKEFGNRGQCNPTYFTVGNLVKELCRIRDEEGLSSEEVVERYAFVTAGACGPCRFGMYVTEYRKALRDAGFDGFRCLLFQQTGGLKQATGEELGLVLNPTFFLAVGRALIAGDVFNALGYRLRPYEVEPGSVDRAMATIKQEIYDALAARQNTWLALWRCRRHLRNIKIDRLKAKPKVAVLGEFWAMTTEGDGNYHLQRFLEQEGAEVSQQMLINTLLYNVWEFRHDTKSRMELRGADDSKYGIAGSDVGLTMAGLYLAELALRLWWHSYANCIGVSDFYLPDMDEVAKAGHSHYNVELRGGEGHMEVAKLIINVVKNKAHMTVSVKPFGCMPSSGVSDGVQSVVTELYPDAIFCPVETSGDGAVNFYSRVQMYLFKARQRAREEFDKALETEGVTQDELTDALGRSRFADTFFVPPHYAAGTAADMVHLLAPFIKKGRLAGELALARTKVKHTFGEVWPRRLGKVRDAMPYMPSLLRYAASEVASRVSPQAAWNAFFDRLTKPTEEEQRLIEAAEQAPPQTVRHEASLPVMA